jgi:hypothetical protein
VPCEAAIGRGFLHPLSIPLLHPGGVCHFLSAAHTALPLVAGVVLLARHLLSVVGRAPRRTVASPSWPCSARSLRVVVDVIEIPVGLGAHQSGQCRLFVYCAPSVRRLVRGPACEQGHRVFVSRRAGGCEAVGKTEGNAAPTSHPLPLFGASEARRPLASPVVS